MFTHCGILGVLAHPFLVLDESVRGLVVRWLQPGRSALGVAAVVAVLLTADVPVPSSIVSTAAGYLLGISGGVLSSFVGMTLGGI